LRVTGCDDAGNHHQGFVNLQGPSHAPMQLDLFLSIASQPRFECARDARQVRRLLARHPDIVNMAAAVVRDAVKEGASRARTDYIVAKLTMFYGIRISNVQREALARLVVREYPDLSRYVHLRRSRKADFIKQEVPA
jgi:hypothetical protein